MHSSIHSLKRLTIQRKTYYNEVNPDLYQHNCIHILISLNQNLSKKTLKNVCTLYYTGQQKL